jgi:hypothetical protein
MLKPTVHHTSPVGEVMVPNVRSHNTKGYFGVRTIQERKSKGKKGDGNKDCLKQEDSFIGEVTMVSFKIGDH